MIPPSLVVAHDAGGAEILASWTKTQSHPIAFLLAGPAVSIFKNKLGPIHHHTWAEIDHLLTQHDHVITGTSWQSDLEKIVIEKCLEKKIKVSSYLDHWINYKDRFMLNKKLVLPNEIWVGDEYALELALKIFSADLVQYIDNPYFAEIKAHKKITTIKTKNPFRLLFLSQPIAKAMAHQHGDPNYLGFHELTAFQYLLNTLKTLAFNPNSEIVIRAHPSDSDNSYSTIAHHFPYPIHISIIPNVLDDCQKADAVVGCFSMAMVVAMLLNKPVYDCIPPAASEIMYRLPHRNIQPITQFVWGVNHV